MSFKLISTVPNDSGDTSTFVRIHKDTETNEYRCRLTVGGEVQEQCDYFTDCLDDAKDTAIRMANGN